MKQSVVKISRIVCAAVVLSLCWFSICEARETADPVVIRKKIRVSTDGGQKTIELEPKSEISVPKNRAENKADAASAQNRVPPYNPVGKIDPFEALFKETPIIQTSTATYVISDRKGSTALEKIDLSQLKLTGIVLAASGNKALVKEASGKGHVISTGTRVGTHGGWVTEVLPDRVVIKEKMKDVAGKLFFRSTELKIN